MRMLFTNFSNSQVKMFEAVRDEAHKGLLHLPLNVQTAV